MHLYSQFDGCKLRAWLLPSTLLLLNFLSSDVLAAGDGNGSALDIFDTAYLFQVFGSLLLVFGCIFGLIFLLKKVNGLPTGDRSPIQVLGSARVGTREKIVLIEAGEQQLLIGVATGNIRTLHVFDRPIIDTKVTLPKKTDFSTLMRSSFGSDKTS